MRHRVISLYKELHGLGRDYPDPACVSNVCRVNDVHAAAQIQLQRSNEAVVREYVVHYRTPRRLLIAIAENRNLTNPEDIEKALKLGEYIKNGTYLTRCCEATAI